MQSMLWQNILHFHLKYPVGWRCRIHKLLLCRWVRPPRRSIWDMTLKIWWWGSSNAGALGNAEYLFIAITPRNTLGWSGSTRKGSSLDQIGLNQVFESWQFLHLNCVFMLNWIARKRTVFTSNLSTYGKLNYLK